MFSNWQYRLLALVLAVACWYMVTGREKVEAWVDVPLEIVNAPQDLVVRGGLPTAIRARIRGSRALMRSRAEKPHVYSLDLSSLAAGENAVVFDKEHLSMPMALEVVEIDPPRLTVVADRLVSRTVPVRAVWKGDPGDDYELVQSRTIPSTVLVRGPQPVVEGLKDIPTLMRDVNATGPGPLNFDAGLALPESVTSEVGSVRVDLEYTAKTKTVWIRLPVKILPESVEGRTVTVKPATIQIQADTTLIVLRQEGFRSLFQAAVVVPASFEAGKHLVPLTVRVPGGCALLKTVPEKVEVRIKKG